jgi:hypothetical protein
LIFSFSSIFSNTPSKPQLSAYSDKWGDLSDCREDLADKGYKISSIISSPTVLTKFDNKDYGNKVYLGIGIEKAYSVEDANALWSFVRNGGNIILADDFGFGNSFWESGLNEGYGRAEFQKKQLFDPNYIKNTTFVTVPARLPWSDTGWYNLLLNAPTALKTTYGSVEFIPLAQSSDESWLDKNENRVRDISEPKGVKHVIMHFQLSRSSGSVFIISDPGLFINENWDKLDNSRYILDLIGHLITDHGEVIFDESRHITENTFENTRRTVYSSIVYITSSVWSIILIVVLIISYTLWIGIKLKPQPIWKNKNLLDRKFLNVLNSPYLSGYDFWQIYNTFLEKVRLGYSFSPDEFKELDQQTLEKLINDRELFNFISYQLPRYADNTYYSYIVNRIKTWKPHVPEADIAAHVDHVDHVEVAVEVEPEPSPLDELDNDEDVEKDNNEEDNENDIENEILDSRKKSPRDPSDHSSRTHRGF